MNILGFKILLRLRWNLNADLCNAGQCKLSYKANWELVIMCANNNTYRKFRIEPDLNND